ncbi:branched-chain amino acid ABC transporter permease [Candidatus Kaiserbacteria bacterium]|nr:branched-chain amino acid ABC transporter permease [Candidatus Kaiserbacteria bacterium]
MEYLVHLGILITIYAILAISLDLVVGYTGLLSVTHAAFFGVGAYTTAILATSFEVNFFFTVLVSIALTALVGLLIGLVLSRFNDDYFALASFGFNVIVYSIFLNWQSLTRGPLGIPGIDKPSLFGFHFNSNSEFLLLSLVFLVAIYYTSHFITSSSFGRVIRAIRDDEEALQVFGYRTTYFKLTVFVIGAGMAAVAGSLFASYITFIDPSSFTLFESVFILSIIILGGLSNHRGALLGAVILILLPEILRFVGFPTDIAAQMRQVVYGLLLVVLMLYRPQGLLGRYRL